MKNILVGQYIRALEPVYRHFANANPKDAKDAIEVADFRNGQKRWWEKDKETKFSAIIPRKMAFSKAMSRFGLETMSEEEKKAYLLALKSVAPRLHIRGQ